METNAEQEFAPEVALDVRTQDRTLGDPLPRQSCLRPHGRHHDQGRRNRGHQKREIHYKDIDIQETSVRLIGTTSAIVLNKIRLLAVVGGNEVTNPFVVTEVYVHESGTWTLASLSFTRLLTP